MKTLRRVQHDAGRPPVATGQLQYARGVKMGRMMADDQEVEPPLVDQMANLVESPCHRGLESRRFQQVLQPQQDILIVI
jgi:hypothetical protein